MTKSGGCMLALSIVTLMICSFITLLAEGLSGGKLLSLPLLWRDFKNLDPGFILRLIAWGALLSPIAGIKYALHSRRQNLGHAEDTTFD